MKLRHLWIPTLVLMLIGGTAKICDTVFSLTGSDFFIDSAHCNFIFVGAILILLIFGAILSLCDKKKNIEVSPSKNIACGLFGFIAAVSIIGGGVINLIGAGNASSNLFLSLLSLLGGAVLLFESCISFTGNNTMTKVPVLALALPLWCSIKFINLFMDYTKVSIQCTEMFDIISMALLLMFLFNQSMFFAGINKNTAARNLIVYGMTFVMSAIVVTTDLIIKRTISNQLTISNIINHVCDIAFCGYAICLMINVVKNFGRQVTDESSNNKENTGVLLTSSENNGQDTVPDTEEVTKQDPVPDTEKVTEQDPVPDTEKVTEQNPAPDTEKVTEQNPVPDTEKVTEQNPVPDTEKVTEQNPVPDTEKDHKEVIDKQMPKSTTQKTNDSYKEIFRLLDEMSSKK